MGLHWVLYVRLTLGLFSQSWHGMHCVKNPQQNMLGEVYLRNSNNALLMHAKRAQYGTCRRIFLYYTRVFRTYIVWCQLTHLQGGWRHSVACYRLNSGTLKVFLTHQIVNSDTLWHNCTNLRLFPYGKLLTRRMPYVNTVQWYWMVNM